MKYVIAWMPALQGLDNRPYHNKDQGWCDEPTLHTRESAVAMNEEQGFNEHAVILTLEEAELMLALGRI